MSIFTPNVLRIKPYFVDVAGWGTATAADIGDIEVSTVQVRAGLAAMTNYALATSGSFGTASGDAPRWFRVPMHQAREASVAVLNGFDVETLVRVHMWMTTRSMTGPSMQLDEFLVKPGNAMRFIPDQPGGVPAKFFRWVPALRSPMRWLIVEFDPVGTPGGGDLQLSIARR